MSVEEPLSTSTNGGIPRSKSFTGELSHKRSPSSNSAEGCGVLESEVGVRTTWGPTLGHYMQSPRLFRRHLSFGSQSKLNKTPRPARTTLMFQKVFEGLKECLSVTQDDITNLKRTSDHLSTHSQQSPGKLYDLGKQLKAAERYMKKLEYQLSKLEELQDQYNIQQNLRQGMKNMANAYVTSSGRERDAALNSVKAGYREATETMCAIESKLEKMMGTLHFTMKGIQGFARLCSGDVFEITIKHSSQKWKIRGRVLKNGQQTWDSPHATFKALLGEILFLKATEVKGLGKTVLLGNKFCETRDLFSAHPQIMTVNLNPSGSLKLNVVITWNPLDGSIDEVMRSHIPTTSACQMVSSNPTPVTSRVPLIEGLVPARSKSFLGQNHLQKFPSQDCLSRPATMMPFFESSMCSDILHNAKEKIFQESFIKTKSPQVVRASSLECCSVDPGEADEESCSESVSVLDAVRNLSMCLEDIQGQYPELQNLEQQVQQLKQTFQRSRRGSNSSEMSTSIESALECFDFLNTESDCDDEEEDLDGANFDSSGEAELVGKASDSGVGSLTHQTTFERSQSENSRCKSPFSNTDQLDLALVIHLSYCLHLAECLGSFGPLKCKEVYALEKLKKQIPVLETLIKLLNCSKEDRKQLCGVDELVKNSEIQLIWTHCLDQNNGFCIPASHMLIRLQELCHPQLNDKSVAFVTAVAKLLITRMLDASRFDAEALVTVFQFKTYFQTVNNFDFEKHITTLAEEVRVIEVLVSYDVPAILETLSNLAASFPSPRCLQTASQLLLVPHHNIQLAAQTFLQKCSYSTSLRKMVLNVFIEAMESESSLTRQCACLSMIHLKSTECINQLAYLYQTDQCANVRSAAKEALLSFGAEGRKAFDQSQLSSLGFQGLGVK